MILQAIFSAISDIATVTELSNLLTLEDNVMRRLDILTVQYVYENTF